MQEEMITTDLLFSPSNPDYALITNISKVPNAPCYCPIMLENKLSQELIRLCEEYHQCIETFSPILADIAEEKIAAFQLCLKENATKIFDLKIEGNEVIFSTKYRCAEGFLDDYWWNL
jgi:hypothetical protein